MTIPITDEMIERAVRANAPKHIWLLMHEGEGGSHIWSDDPDPTGTGDHVAVEYVRAAITDEMVERVARTICRHFGAADPDMEVTQFQQGVVGTKYWEGYRAGARAAIEATLNHEEKQMALPRFEPMQLVHELRMPNVNRDIGSAVEEECESEAVGALESAHDTARRTAVFLGQLIRLLHAKGVLSDSEVLGLLGDLWEAGGVIR